MISIIKFNYFSCSNMNYQQLQMQDINSQSQPLHQNHAEVSFSLESALRQHSLFQLNFQQKVETFKKEEYHKGVSFTSRKKKKEWTQHENILLLNLHDQLGNKWSAIARQFAEKTENDVKNHFFSRLRMSLRHLNRGLSVSKSQSVKVGVLYKAMGICEESFKKQSKQQKELLELSFEIKRSFFNFLNYPSDNNKIYVEAIMKNIKKFHLMTQVSPKKTSFHTVKQPSGFDQFNQDKSIRIRNNIQGKGHKIRNMKTICSEGESPQNKEIQVEQIEKPTTDGLIAKPSFCLIDPFEQVRSVSDIDRDPFFCPQSIKFSLFEEQPNSNDYQPSLYLPSLNQFSHI